MMQLRRLARYDALLLTTGIWFLAKFLRYAFPPLFATFRGEFGVSTALIGTAFSALMVTYAAMQFPSGVLADKLDPVSVIVAGALITSLGALSFLVEGPFPVLVAGMVLVGLGTGAHKTVAVRLLSMIYPRRTGRALGILDTLAGFGGVAAPAAVVAVLPNWRGLFLASGLVGIALAVLFRGTVPRRNPGVRGREGPDGGGGSKKGNRPEGGVSLRTYALILLRPRVVLFLGVLMAFGYGYSGVVAFLPLYLVEAAGLGTTTANAIYAALFFVSIAQLGTGELADHVGQLLVIAVALAVAAAGLLALQFVSGPFALGAAVIAIGLGGHGYRPTRAAYLMTILPDNAAGGGLGAIRTIFMAASAVAPAIVGVLITTTGYSVAFATLAGAMVIAVALVVVLLLVDG